MFYQYMVSHNVQSTIPLLTDSSEQTKSRWHRVWLYLYRESFPCDQHVQQVQACSQDRSSVACQGCQGQQSRIHPGTRRAPHRCAACPCRRLLEPDFEGQEWLEWPVGCQFFIQEPLTQSFIVLSFSPFSILVNRHPWPNAHSILPTPRRTLRSIFRSISRLLTSLVPWNS